MAYSSTFDQQSNKADFTFEITATDADTGALVDFTGADVVCSIRDKRDNCQLVTISTDDSTITLPDANTLSFLFAKTVIGNLCGHYNIGCVFEKNGLTTQLFIGTVSFYDGIASV